MRASAVRFFSEIKKCYMAQLNKEGMQHALSTKKLSTLDLFVTPIANKSIREGEITGFLPIEFSFCRFGIVFQASKNPVEVEGLRNTFAWKNNEDIDINVIAKILDDEMIIIGSNHQEETIYQEEKVRVFKVE